MAIGVGHLQFEHKPIGCIFPCHIGDARIERTGLAGKLFINNIADLVCDRAQRVCGHGVTETSKLLLAKDVV